jgi:hypothetical protein
LQILHLFFQVIQLELHGFLIIIHTYLYNNYVGVLIIKRCKIKQKTIKTIRET